MISFQFNMLDMMKNSSGKILEGYFDYSQRVG